jgi:hypothetical protein
MTPGEQNQIVEILLNQELSEKEKGERLRALLPPEGRVPFVELYTLDAAESERYKEALELGAAIQKEVLRLIAKSEKGE